MYLSLCKKLEGKFNAEPKKDYHCSKCDQPDERIWWDQAQTNYEGISQGFQVILIHARVDNKEKNRRHLRWSRESILDSSVLGEKFRR